jgi:hypothetical protein
VGQSALGCLQNAIPAVSLSPRQKYQLARPTSLYRSEAREDYYIFMTALVDFGEAAKKYCCMSNLIAADLITQSHAFGREPNVLPKLCNCYAYSTIKAPDKGEVGGSSPPRPTIQFTSKYAAILTFPLFGAFPQKIVLSTVCQLHDWPDGTTLRA